MPPPIGPRTQETPMTSPALRSRRAKVESVLLTCLAVMIGPSLAWALSWLGLG
jgi:hypothetical protein